MKELHFKPICWLLISGKVMTCHGHPAQKLQIWVCHPAFDDLAFYLLQAFSLPSVMFLPPFLFPPRSFETRSLLYKSPVTLFPCRISNKPFKWRWAKDITLRVPRVLSPRLIKRKTSRIRFVKLQRTGAHTCTLHLSSAIIKGACILLSPPIWHFIILSTWHPLSLTDLIPHVMMITSPTLI